MGTINGKKKIQSERRLSDRWCRFFFSMLSICVSNQLLRFSFFAYAEIKSDATVSAEFSPQRDMWCVARECEAGDSGIAAEIQG